MAFSDYDYLALLGYGWDYRIMEGYWSLGMAFYATGSGYKRLYSNDIASMTFGVSCIILYVRRTLT